MKVSICRPIIIVSSPPRTGELDHNKNFNTSSVVFAKNEIRVSAKKKTREERTCLITKAKK